MKIIFEEIVGTFFRLGSLNKKNPRAIARGFTVIIMVNV